MKRRDVVSNFIIRDIRSREPQVALFRRSEAVRTYAGKLAPISGSIDAGDESPLQAAVREIREETGLVVGGDLELWLRGKPFGIVDEGIGRSWTVWPFSWVVKGDPERVEGLIAIDWEHVGWRWIEASKILKRDAELEGDCVPRLGESLWRVWIGEGGMFYRDGSTVVVEGDDGFAGERLLRCLMELRRDHESGARQLAQKAVDCLLEIVEVAERDPRPGRVQGLWEKLRMSGWHLINNGRESMGAAIGAAVLNCLKAVEGAKEDKEAMILGIKSWLEEWKSASERIGEELAMCLSRVSDPEEEAGRTIRILTLSSSSTFEAAFLTAMKRCECDFDLRILESRPLCEGTVLASKLIASARREGLLDKLRITLATDASAAILAKDVDFVILGADRISEVGDVSNKTGSFPAVLSAKAVASAPRSHGPKVVVLSETEKIAKPGGMDEHGEEDNDPREVQRVWDQALGMPTASLLDEGSKVEVRNVYFEWVPAEYVDLYITEKGQVGTEEIKKQSQLILRLEEEMFNDI